MYRLIKFKDEHIKTHPIFNDKFYICVDFPCDSGLYIVCKILKPDVTVSINEGDKIKKEHFDVIFSDGDIDKVLEMNMLEIL